MKQMFGLLVVALAITAGCRAQQITPSPVLTAPVVTSTAYSQITTAPGITAATYTDLPATGSYCYFVQLLDGAGVSAASNTVCNTTTTALKHIALNWAFPAGYSCQSTCTYMVSRAVATQTPVGVPALQPATQAAQLEAPAGPALPQVARLELTSRPAK